MISDSELVGAINTFAASISSQPLGLAHHLPESYADHTRCFENAMKKMAEDGGRVQFGWIFGHRYPSHLPQSNGYLMATHHAVWHSPDGSLIDVTPLHPDPKHQPFRPNGSILFQVDSSAEPVVVGKYMAPLPIIFFPLDNDDALTSYVRSLNQKEQASCKELYEQLVASELI